MQKLIELLNEYVEETDFWDNLDEYNEADIIDGETLEVNWNYHDIEYLYTKQFWFIQRLVEQDKIDRYKKEIEKSDYDITFTWALTMDKKSDWDIMVDTLLMLLSIQDEPIEFLVSILK